MKLTSILMMLILLVLAPALTNAEDKPAAKAEPNADHRKEGEQLLGSARDQTRVEYAKTGRAPKKLSDRKTFEADDFKGKHFTVADTVYVVGDAGKQAALIAEPADAADGFAIIVFAWDSGNSAISWYETLEALKNGHKDLKFGDDAKEEEAEKEVDKEGDAEVSDNDPFALYKKKGRTWTVKSVIKIQGMDDMVNYMKNEVMSVSKDAATVKTWMLDKDKKAFAGMDPTEYEVKFVVAKAPDDGGVEVPEFKEETIEVEAGKFECYLYESHGTKTWMSKKYPGLLVKMEHATGLSELIEFKDGE